MRALVKALVGHGFGIGGLALLSACNSAADSPPASEPTEPPSEVASTPGDEYPPPLDGELSEGMNGFAANLYWRLDAEASPGDNIFFSPFSIESAFGILLAGANGDTATQIRKPLGLPADETHGRLGETTKALQSGGAGPILRIANALWVQRDYPVKPDFLRTAQRDYGASARNLDLRGAPEPAAKQINNWVAEQTNDRITNLIAPSMLDGSTVLVITNAIYFLGDWRDAFEPKMTREEPFSLGGGGIAKVPLMSRNVTVPYVRDEGFQAVDLPYRSSDLVMSIILPDDARGLDAIEKKVGDGLLSDALGRLDAAAAEEVRLSLPKLEIETEIDLKPPLFDLGMRLPFQPQADLTGIADADLMVSAAVHKAFLKMDEKGTEAAAATGIAVTEVAAAAPPPEFRADHPFLFAIRDKKSGTILFLGRISDPRGK